MEYQPLNPQRNEIRLLTVQPPVADNDEPIVCTLEHVSLDDVYLQYRIFWILRDLTRNYLANWIPAPVLSAAQDGIVFHAIHFGSFWTFANALSYVARISISFNPWGFRSFIVFLTAAQVVRNQHPNLLYFYKTALEVRTELRQSWPIVLSLLGVHCLLFPISLMMVHSLELVPAILVALTINLVKENLWPVEVCRPHLSKKGGTFRYAWGDYGALSYVWGPRTHTTDITVNGVSVQITENLGLALLSYRNGEFARRGFKIWVDAICINQNDLDERNQQVKRMLSIYQKAFTVLIWLGKPEDDSQLAIKQINTVNKVYSFAYGNVGRYKLSKAVLQNMDSQTFRALGYFFARPYWMRMWIIQELSVVQNETTLVCGHESITWQGLCDIVDLFMFDWDRFYSGLRNTGDKKFQEAGNTFLLLTRLRTLKEYILQMRSGPIIESLGLLITLCELSEATDNRDKVYGMLGLVDPAISARVHPDYRIGLQSTYTSFTRAVIEVTRDLSIIHGGNREVMRDYDPTWVVDYRGGPNRWRPSFDDPSNACSGKKAVVSFSACGNILTAKGFMIDTVDGVSGRQIDWFKGSPQPSSIAQTTTKHHAYGDDDGLARALNRTLIGYRLPDHFIPSESMLAIPWVDNAAYKQPVPPHFRNTPWASVLANEWYGDFESFRQVNASFNLFTRPLRSFFPATLPSLPSGTDPDSLAWPMSLTAQSLYGRKLVTTRNGYLGLGVGAIEPGDKIFILFGSKSPVALRGEVNGSGYKIVGEMYLAGVMNGEAMGRGKVEDVVLC